jgi:hypothetical protein
MRQKKSADKKNDYPQYRIPVTKIFIVYFPQDTLRLSFNLVFF